MRKRGNGPAEGSNVSSIPGVDVLEHVYPIIQTNGTCDDSAIPYQSINQVHVNNTWTEDTHISPVAKIARTPTFRRLGICSFKTIGIGR